MTDDWFYKTYLNVRKCLGSPEYRNLDIIDKEMTANEFRHAIQRNDYILIKSKSKDKRHISTFLYNEDIIPNARTVIQTIQREANTSTDVIMITSELFKLKNKKKIISECKQKIYNYSLFIFIKEIPKGLLVGTHIILTNEEAQHIYNNVLRTTSDNIQQISVNDPPLIWIGAKVGQLIKINAVSIDTMKYIYYRFVIAKPKMSSSKDNGEEVGDGGEDGKEVKEDDEVEVDEVDEVEAEFIEEAEIEAEEVDEVT